jgi:hypothetical protein
MNGERTPYGCVAQFCDGEALTEAVRRARREGYRRIEAYAPLPVEGLAEALGYQLLQIPALMLMGGVTGALVMYFIEFYSAMVDYPFNIGGRPYNSWPGFLFVGIEMTLLGAALFGVLGMLILNRLPSLYHPIFDAGGFERASRDGFFLCLRADGPGFDAARAEALLHELGALQVEELAQ